MAPTVAPSPFEVLPSPNALRVEEMERRYREVTSQVQAHSREVLARLVPPIRPRSTPITQSESQEMALATAGPAAEEEGFQFNPLTAERGEFRPGAAGWRSDQRSRRERATDRDRERTEQGNRVWQPPTVSVL